MKILYCDTLIARYYIFCCTNSNSYSFVLNEVRTGEFHALIPDDKNIII